MDVSIRSGSDQDIDACVELWTRVIAARDGQDRAPEVTERAREAFERPVVRFAAIGSPPEAFALTVAKEHRVAQFSRLCVDPSVTSRGLGAALVADAVEHARGGGFVRVDLDVRETNTRAIALYARAGFVATSDARNYDGGAPVVTWSLDLDVSPGGRSFAPEDGPPAQQTPTHTDRLRDVPAEQRQP